MLVLILVLVMGSVSDVFNSGGDSNDDVGVDDIGGLILMVVMVLALIMMITNLVVEMIEAVMMMMIKMMVVLMMMVMLTLILVLILTMMMVGVNVANILGRFAKGTNMLGKK